MDPHKTLADKVKTFKRRKSAFLLFVSVLFCYTNSFGQNATITNMAVELLKSNCEGKDQISRNICTIVEVFESNHLDRANVLIDSALIHDATIPNETSFQLKIVKARIYKHKGLHNESLNLYDELLTISQNNNSLNSFETGLRLTIADLLIEIKEFDKAIILLKTGIMKVTDSKLLQKVQHNLGVAYIHLAKYDSAEKYLNLSLELKKQTNDFYGLSAAYMDQANLYYSQYLDNKAIPLFEKGLEYALLAQNDKILRNAYLNMAVVEENRNRPAKALEYRKEYEKIVEKLWNRDKVWELAEQEKQFEVSLKEKEIALLEEQDKARLAEIRTQSLQRNFILLIAFILLLGIIGVALILRRVRMANKIISAQKDELAELNATKNKLFSIVAHDLRSPVAAIQKSHKKLHRAISTNDEQRVQELLSENEKIAESTYSLLNNLLHWALDQSNSLHLQPDEYAVSRVIDQVVFDYKGPIAEKEIVLHTEAPANLMIYADLNSLKMIIRNLLDNAIKFTPATGQINITAQAAGDETLITIQDSGIGMTQEQTDHLFSSRHSGTDTTGKRSTGLGLQLIHALTLKNNGQIAVQSVSGKGTTFILKFPTNLSI